MHSETLPEKPQEGEMSAQPEQNLGDRPPDSPPLEGRLSAAYARWGVLPPRLQEALRSASASEVPLRYRRWLEQYHRRGEKPR
jgi:hypothetical protein